MRQYHNQRNPVLPPDVHVPDGAAHVMPDGRLYIYGSSDEHDVMYCSDQYFVVSTPDMENWTIHDRSLSGWDVPWFNNPDVPKPQEIDLSNPSPFIQKMIDDGLIRLDGPKEKPEKRKMIPLLYGCDAIHKDGKYYLYFGMADDSEGLAVSDRPEGPFKIVGQLPCGGIDPAVLVDDDGKVYYFWGQLYAHGVELNEDMVSFDPAAVVDNVVTEEKNFFHEGSAVRKFGENYYYFNANIQRGKPTAIGYSMSKHPFGPYTYKGILIDNADCDPASWNNSGCIEYFQGQYYLFYHKSSRNSQIHRRLCIEPVTMNADGTFDEVKMTSQGVGDPFAPGETILGYQACGLKGAVYIDVDPVYEESLTNISEGDEAIFRYVRSDRPWSTLNIRGEGNGTVEVWVLPNCKEESKRFLAGVAELIDGTCTSAPIQAPAGEYELILRFRNPQNMKVGTLVLN